MELNVAGYDIDILEEIPDRYAKSGATGVALSGMDVILSKLLAEEDFNRLSARCLRNTVPRSSIQQHANPSLSYTFDTAETITVPSPQGIGETPERLQDQAGTYHIAQPAVHAIDDVSLFGTHGVVRLSNGRVILETALARKRLFKRKLSMRPLDVLYYELADYLPSRPISDTPLVPMVWGYGNYHHWVFNCLTMLQGIEQYRKQTGDTCQLLIPPDPPSWIPESLQFFGFAPEQLIEWKYRYGDARRVVIPTIRRIENPTLHKQTNDRTIRRKIVSPNACQWLQETARARLSDTSAMEFSSRVIISRADAGRRMLQNRDELYDLLYDRGFEEYQLANLTFEEQVALFANADCVVSPHGAGFSNLVFADQCDVLEILGTHATKPTYYLLANSAGHRYRFVIGEQPHDGDSDDDIYLAPERLEQGLDALGY